MSYSPPAAPACSRGPRLGTVAAATALDLLNSDPSSLLSRPLTLGRPRGDKSAAKLARERYEAELRRAAQAPADLLDFDASPAAASSAAPATSPWPTTLSSTAAAFAPATCAASSAAAGSAALAWEAAVSEALPRVTLPRRAPAGLAAAPMLDLLDLDGPAAQLQAVHLGAGGACMPSLAPALPPAQGMASWPQTLPARDTNGASFSTMAQPPLLVPAGGHLAAVANGGVGKQPKEEPFAFVSDLITKVPAGR